MLTVSLLGAPVFALNHQPLSPLLTGRTAALLIYLALTRTPQPRTLLADLLWDNRTEQQAKSNLRYPLRDLRKAVGDYVVVNNETVTFNQDLPHWVDVTVFTNYLTTTATHTVEPAILPELLNLYSGEFLAGFQIENAPVFEQWVLTQRYHCHDLFVQGLQLRIQHHLAQGEYAAGLAVNRTLLTLEPWREEAHRQRMMLLAHSDQRSAALRQYTLCCQTLAEELGVPPTAETTALYEQIKAEQWLTTPATAGHWSARSGASTPSSQSTNASPVAVAVPVAQPPAERARFDLGAMPELAHFYGRQAELALLRSWIGQEHCRLVAILGVGGQGKTALAATFVQEAIEEAPAFAHGFTRIIWRSLYGAPSCIALLQDWLQALDDGEHDGQAEKQGDRLPLTFDNLITRLFMLLQTQRCLLVLDGVETILAQPNREEGAHSIGYHPDSEAYGALLGLLSQRRHRSCVLLTSRSRATLLTRLDERKSAFKCLELGGLTVAESAALLKAQGVTGNPTLYHQLHQHYGGNPLLLNRAANLIHDIFEGDETAFLQEGRFFLGDIGATPAQQLARLPPLEQQVMYVLAAAGQPLGRPALWQRLSPPPAKEQYFTALQGLQRSFLVQQENAQIKLPALLAAYLAERDLPLS